MRESYLNTMILLLLKVYQGNEHIYEEMMDELEKEENIQVTMKILELIVAQSNFLSQPSQS